MELRLDRRSPRSDCSRAINVEASSTRKEELLMPTEELALVWRLRRVLHALEPGALELLTDKIGPPSPTSSSCGDREGPAS